MADIEAPRLESESNAIRAAGGDIRTFVCDVSDPTQVEALRDFAVAEYGTVHILCNNAGVANGRQTYKSTPGEWQWVLGVNTLGVAYGVSAFVPLMIAQGEGHVVNTASEAGLTSSPALGPYHASKYAVVGMSETLAMELHGTGVGVSCLCPELVDTKVFESTRNAPPELGMRPPVAVPIEQIAALMNTVAMNPADVAADVVYAIRADRFWIITHQVTQDRIRRRNADLESGRKPRYAG